MALAPSSSDQLSSRYEVKKDGLLMDFMTDEGIFHAIALARRLKPVTGLQTFATVCSTWVWISRSSTRRSRQNVLGNQWIDNVAKANAMVSRMCLLICFLSARFISWILEQPASSLMVHHPRMRQIKEFSKVESGAGLSEFHEVKTSMGAFGAATRKPSKLYSSEKWIAKLERSIPAGFRPDPQLQTSTVDAFGGVTGGRDLQATQAYPDRYGQELLRVWRRHKRTKPSHWPADDESEDSDEFEEDAWHDTNMDALVRKKKVSLYRMPF